MVFDLFFYCVTVKTIYTLGKFISGFIFPSWKGHTEENYLQGLMGLNFMPRKHANRKQHEQIPQIKEKRFSSFHYFFLRCCKEQDEHDSDWLLTGLKKTTSCLTPCIYSFCFYHWGTSASEYRVGSSKASALVLETFRLALDSVDVADWKKAIKKPVLFVSLSVLVSEKKLQADE